MLAQLDAILRGVQLELTGRELAEVLWLALQLEQLDPAGAHKRPASNMASTQEPLAQAQEDEQELDERGRRRQSTSGTATSSEGNLYQQPAEEQPPSVSMRLGRPFRSPAASALPQSLDLGRALRPLRRRVPSRVRAILDEPATAQQIAEGGVFLPVLRPALTRWMDVALVVDAGASMQIWRQTVLALRRLLECEGAFRDIRMWSLATDDGVQLRCGFGPQARQAPRRDLTEVCGPEGRHLILLVTDCVSRAWHTGAIAEVLQRWAQRHPLVLVQVLPQRYWDRSALEQATPVRFRSLLPGVPNTLLQGEKLRRSPERGLPPGIPLPVVTLEPVPLGAYARVLAGRGNTWTTGVVLAPVAPGLAAADDWETSLEQPENGAEAREGVERVQLFRATASVMARRLAGFLAAAPCHLSLPVIRQIQHVMLPMSEQIHVAEIFLSALLQRLTPDRSGLDPDMVQYDFLPGVRLELLNGVPRTEALQVVDKVTEFINECAGQASDFFVLLPDADAPQGVAFPADSRAFASLKAQVLRRFGDEFARLADELERQATTAAQAGVEEPQPVTPTSDKAAYSATVEPSTVTPPLSDPVQALLDLRLPQSLIALLAPILESLGYSIEQAETTRSEAGGYRLYTLVTNGVTRRPLLYIPMWILNDASRPNPMAVDSMIYAFDSGAMLYIVSEGLDTPAWAFRHMFAEVWLQKQQIKAIFVPWRDIEHLASIGPNAQRVEIKNLFDLEEEAPGLIEEEAPGLIPVTGAWTSIFYGQAKVDLQTLLPGYLQRRRWFGGKSRTIRSAVIQETIPIPQRSPMGYISLIQVDYTEGSPEIYALPLTFASDKSADWVRMAFPEAVVARLQVARPAVEGVLYDALYDRAFALELLDAMAKHQRFTGVSGDIVASSVASSTFFRPPWRSRRRDASLKPYILPAELAHTRVIYGNKFFLKCFRLLQDGVSPDLEIGRFLTKHKFAYSPPLAGAIEYHRQVGAPVTLAMLQGFVAHQEDAGQYTLSALRDFFEQILAGQAESERATIPRQLLLGLSAAAIPPFVGEFIGTYLEAARLLGQRTAELHIALASAPDDPNFAPEPFSMSYQRSIYQTIQSQASQVFQLLRDSLQVLPDVREEAQKVLELESEVQRRLQLLLQHQIDTTRIRLHGDYHLGQVLYTGSDFVIIDFEGEPPRPLSERRLKHSPLRDVASMLTSFHYASYAALFDTEGVGRREDFAALEPWVRFWQYWVSTAFLQSYLATASGLPPLLPQSQEALQVLLEAYLLEKSIYALGYELYNRPTWVWVPIEGILQLLDQSDAPSGRRGIRRSGQSQSAGPGTSGRDRVRRRR